MMDEFVLIFRMDITTADTQPTPEQMQVYLKQWDEWINEIAKKNQLAEGGHHLSTEGRVLRPNRVITNGPYAENKESIAGYILIKASNFEEAVSIAVDCPILQGDGTSVEIRKVAI